MSEQAEPNYEGVTARHISNLRVHADFIEAQPSISMHQFATDANGDRVSLKDIHTCGTAMCAVGLIPLNTDVAADVSNARSFEEVSEFAFGFSPESSSFTMTAMWSSLFGGSVPNDPIYVAEGMRRSADYFERQIKASAA